MKKFVIFALILSIFANITSAQSEYGTGLIFNDEEYQRVPLKASLTRSLYTHIPESFSLKKYAPIPKSQGSYGTCTAWSIAYAAMTILESKEENRTNRILSTQSTFSPGFIYKHIKNAEDENCKLGSSIRKALELVKTKGVPKYTEMKEVNCPTFIPPDIYSEASKHKIKDYAKIFGLYDGDDFKVSATKKSLSQGNPVIIGMSTPDSFNNADSLWSPTESGGNYGGHAMCVIGYDDNKYGGAFEFMNSWGTGWGDGGFTWVKYDDYSEFVKYAYEMIDIKSKKSGLNSFAGSIRFKLADGSIAQAGYQSRGQYKMKQAFRSGERFRLYIKTTENAYVYAFGTDASQKIFPVFPHKKGISAAMNYTENEIALPDEQHYIQTDNTIGTDYLCVIFSKNPIDIAAVHKKVQAGTGSFQQKINQALSTKLINPESIDFKDNAIRFKASDKSKTALAVIVETEHIK